MINNQPIGILDSGIGGMTVLKRALDKLPNEDFIFICDQKNLPYGSKTKDEIINFTRKMVNFLISKNVKTIVFACNTATAEALDTIQSEIDIPLIGVIKSGSTAAIELGKKRIGLIATQATIKSKRYEEEIKALNENVEVISKATPDFVPMIESGVIDKNIIAKNLEYFDNKNIDGLILGCTHYPIIEKEINDYFDDNVKIIDPSFNVVKILSESLKKSDNEADNKQKVSFYTTKDNLNLNNSIEKILNIKDAQAQEVILGD